MSHTALRSRPRTVKDALEVVIALTAVGALFFGFVSWRQAVRANTLAGDANIVAQRALGLQQVASKADAAADAAQVDFLHGTELFVRNASRRPLTDVRISINYDDGDDNPSNDRQPDVSIPFGEIAGCTIVTYKIPARAEEDDPKRRKSHFFFRLIWRDAAGSRWYVLAVADRYGRSSVFGEGGGPIPESSTQLPMNGEGNPVFLSSIGPTSAGQCH